jgi:hypothetical protein
MMTTWRMPMNIGPGSCTQRCPSTAGVSSRALSRRDPTRKFRFKNKLLSRDATVIDLCARVFDWARFLRTKGAVKLHLLLDHKWNGFG